MKWVKWEPLVPRIFIRPFIKKNIHWRCCKIYRLYWLSRFFSFSSTGVRLLKNCHGTRQGILSSSITYMNHFFLFFFLSLEVSHFPTRVLQPPCSHNLWDVCELHFLCLFPWGVAGGVLGGGMLGGVSIRMIPHTHLSEKVRSGGPCFCSDSTWLLFSALDVEM